MLSCSGKGWLSQVRPCLFFLSTVLEQQCSLCPWCGGTVCSGDMSYALPFVSTLDVQTAPPYTPNIVNSKALLFAVASGLRTILHNFKILSIHFTSPFLPFANCIFHKDPFVLTGNFLKFPLTFPFLPVSCHRPWAFICPYPNTVSFQDTPKPPTPISS